MTTNSYVSVNQLVKGFAQETEIYKLIVYFDNFKFARFNLVNIEPLILGLKKSKDSKVETITYDELMQKFPNLKFIKVHQYLFTRVHIDPESKVLRKIVIDGEEIKNEDYTYHKCSLWNVEDDGTALKDLQDKREEVKKRIKEEMYEFFNDSDGEIDIDFA